MAKRVAAMLLSVGLFAAVPSTAIPADPNGMAERAAIETALSMMMDAQRKKPAIVGDWFLHPDGFGFRIPEGLSYEAPPRGTQVTLVDDESADLRTTITVTITDEVGQLYDMKEKDVEGAAKMKGFSQVKMLFFGHEKMAEKDVLRYAFLTGSSPRFVSELRMFNHGGKCFILTLNAEHTQGRLLDAVKQLNALCDSLFFIDEAV